MRERIHNGMVNGHKLYSFISAWMNELVSPDSKTLKSLGFEGIKKLIYL